MPQKVYYYHTTKLDATKLGVVPPCTIALKKEGDKFVYGVSICSRYDNFSKKYGREVAENRLNLGFGVMDIPDSMKSSANSDHELCMQQLFNLVVSVVKKNKKWKKKITRFNLEQRSRDWDKAKLETETVDLPNHLKTWPQRN